MTKEQEDKIIAQAQDIIERRLAVEKDIKVNLLHIALYAACRQMGMAIVPKDIGARVVAWVGLAGADERICYSPRLRCELEHLQEVYHIQGGDVPDKDFVELIQVYTKELQEYTDAHNGECPDWLNKLIEERYGFKPYEL